MDDEVKRLRSEAAELAKKHEQLERILHHTQDRFQKIFHASSNMMAITTVQDGRIIDLNEASAGLGGHKREELIGALSAEHNLWADAKQREMVVQTLRKEGRVHNFEVDFIGEEGEIRKVLFSADPIVVDGESCLLGTSVDVTAREKEEAALRKSEEKYRMLVENSLLGVTISQEDRFIFCNSAFALISGYSIEELLSLRDVNMLCHPDDREFIYKLRRAGMSGKPTLRGVECRLIRKDGEERWIETYASPIEYNGKPAAQCTHRDITERKQTENALRDSEERFRLIAESIDEVFWIFDPGKQAITYVSPIYERIWGSSRDNFFDLQNPLLDPIHPEDRERVLASISMAKAGQLLHYEHRIVRPDGEIRHMRIKGFPVYDKGGKIRLYIGVGEDVTESKRAQAALNESREYLNQIINHIGDSVFVKDRRHRFVLVNEAFRRFFASPTENYDGQLNLDRLPKELAASILEDEEKVFLTGKESITEDILKDSKGNVHVLMTRKSLLTDKSGNQQIIGVQRDITEYKQLEAQLMQAQKMEAIGVLAGGVAHDFNNLLNVINGYSELILGELPPDDPVRKDIEQIKNAGKRAAELTSQLLAFGRKQILKPELLDLNDVIARMSSMLRRLIAEDIEFVVSTKSDLGLIHADPGQMQQIVMNLAINARDAMPLGGKLVIETANVDLAEPYAQRRQMVPEGPYVMLAISDNGIGMDEATRERVFEPFFSTKQKGKGTGLGLSTVYGIVKQSGGFIWVYSEPGRGTTFKIYFPKAEGALVGRKEEELLKPDLRGSETVLLVEDEMAVKELAARILREQGYNVLEASNGTEALRIAQEYAGEIHLIVTDVVMPGFSGKALVSRLESARPDIKALYISGYTDDAIVHHGILDSHVEFLQKPFTGGRLVRKVREVLNS
ncbi:MAG: PAS domain S-box protein [Acidobacteria bacterium]|nr:PAS domain S-box protein [Acidobacteriota bacterium]